MTFNKEITALRVFLKREHDRVTASGGCYTVRQAIRELEHGLCTLTDRGFVSADGFRSEVLRILYAHDPVHFLVRPKNKSEEFRISKIRNVFAAQLDRVLAGEIDGDMPVLPYRRVLTGDEAKEVREKFTSVWHYDGSYWYPLSDCLPDGMGEHAFYLPEDHVMPHWDALMTLLGLPERPVYKAKEYDPDGLFYELTGEMTSCGFTESAYSGADFSWLIYFSHEGTVSFAGSIAEAAKELLRDEAAYFNKWNDDEREFDAELNDLRVTLMRTAERYNDKALRYAGELDTRLCTLTDLSFPPEFFRAIVKDLLSDYEKSVQGSLRNQAEAYMVKSITKTLRDRVDLLIDSGAGADVPLLPYRRVIRGRDAERVIRRLRDDLYPLIDRTLDGSGDGLYLMTEYVLPYADALSRLMGLPDQPVYKRVECDPLVDWCEMVGALVPDSKETAYAPADYSWLVLFSMEGVVHFEGTIVGQVRGLLRDEAEHFNFMDK
ncbi:MAG: hypothetical protein MJ192_07585 [Clostridia bacterium]|nr:hypothetical protein [Clostridia bacterium]